MLNVETCNNKYQLSMTDKSLKTKLLSPSRRWTDDGHPCRFGSIGGGAIHATHLGQLESFTNVDFQIAYLGYTEYQPKF